MDDAKTFLLRIEKRTPDRMPFARLVEYMRHFAILLGATEHVHFCEIVTSSTIIRALVEHEAIPEVNQRMRSASAGVGPSDVMFALAALDRMLVNDNTSGSVRRIDRPVALAGSVGEPDHEETMIRLLGAEREAPPVFGPFLQPTTLHGVVIRVGGRNQEVPVHIETRTGIESHCFATREMAKEFGKRLFDGEFRFYGDGKWIRNEDGKWKLQRFTITRFEPLDNSTLSDAILELRSIKGRDWRGSDPWAELQEIRGSDGDDEE